MGTRVPTLCVVQYARTTAIGWNLLGILDLIVALITGVTYVPPFVPQLAATGASTMYVIYVLTR